MEHPEIPLVMPDGDVDESRDSIPRMRRQDQRDLRHRRCRVSPENSVQVVVVMAVGFVLFFALIMVIVCSYASDCTPAKEEALQLCLAEHFSATNALSEAGTVTYPHYKKALYSFYANAGRRGVIAKCTTPLYWSSLLGIQRRNVMRRRDLKGHFEWREFTCTDPHTPHSSNIRMLVTNVLRHGGDVDNSLSYGLFSDMVAASTCDFSLATRALDQCVVKQIDYDGCRLMSWLAGCSGDRGVELCNAAFGRALCEWNTEALNVLWNCDNNATRVCSHL